MKINRPAALVVALLVVLFVPLLSVAGTGKDGEAKNLDFISNRGQMPAFIHYKANVAGGAVFFTQQGFTYSYYSIADLNRIHDLRHEGGQADVSGELVRSHAYRVSFEGARQDAIISGREKQTAYHNYFLGNDAAQWATAVPLYRRLRYSNLYPGIDLSVYSTGASMKYDFVVAPGADPSKISLLFDGVSPQIMPSGDLQITTSVNTVTEKAPVVYQMIEGRRKEVPARYTLHSKRLGFIFPEGYNSSYPLIIDPTLVFGTYSGSTATTFGFSATYDASGALYSGGECFGTGWPVSTGAFQTTFGSGVDAGINKYSATGSALIYSTYYGGSGSDLPNNMIVNAANELIMTGSTTSANLPRTPGCYDDTINGGSDAYVAHFNATGTALIGATFVGGSGGDANGSSAVSNGYGDQNRGEVLTDAAGNIFVATTTSSTDFPVTAGAYQTTFGGVQDAVVFKLNGTCTSLIWSTYFGGNGGDAAFSLVKTSSGHLAVCGGTRSTNLPVAAGSYQTSLNGANTDAFVAILTANGSSLTAATYMGTNAADVGYKIQVDAQDNLYVMGQSAGAFPISAGVYNNPVGNIFIAKLNSSLSSMLLSTKIGAAGNSLVPSAFLYDQCGRIYFCGYQASSGLDVSPNAFQANPGGFWLCVMSVNMSALTYATYMGTPGDHLDGGTSRFDPHGIVYHSVCVGNNTFPTIPTAYAPTKSSGASWDIASFKFNFETTILTAGVDLGTQNDSGCKPYTVVFNNTTIGADYYLWDFGDGSPQVTGANVPPHTYYTPGVYIVKLKTSSGLCALADSTTIKITVLQPPTKPKLALKDTFICSSDPLLLTATVLQSNTNQRFKWAPASAVIGNAAQQQVLVNPFLETLYTVYVSDSVLPGCQQADTAQIRLRIRTLNLAIAGDTTICPGDTTILYAVSSTEGDASSAVTGYTWWPTGIRAFSPAPDTLVASPFGNTSVNLKAQNSYGCAATAHTSIIVHDIPSLFASEDVIMRNGSTTQMTVAGGGGSYLWTPATGLSSNTSAIPLASPKTSTTYIVTGTSIPDGCITKDSVHVTIVNVLVPTAFSPNGDGLNDAFHLIISNPAVVQLELEVYNRYGQRIFASANVKHGWDGTFKNTPVEIGTYFWKITYSIGHENFTEKGDVALIR